jgi:anti-sigma B factor antagonist
VRQENLLTRVNKIRIQPSLLLEDKRMKPNEGFRVNRVKEIAMLKVDAKKLDTVAVLCLQGQIVHGETEILRNAVQSLSNVSAVRLDLARVTTVDASGLGVMLALREQAESKGIRFELMNVTKWVRRVLELTRLDSVFQITSAVEFFPPVSRGQRAVVMRLASCA